MPIATASAAEIVREVDDRLAERRVHLVGAAVGDEGAVELELGERQLLEPGERRIAAAEIVDRELDVELRELLGHLVGQRKVGDDLLFGDVDDQPGPLLDLLAMRPHEVGDRQLHQRADRDVDGEAQIDPELARTRSPALSALAIASSDSFSSSASVAPGMNAPGSRMPLLRMAAARERLDAGELLLAQVDLRLIPELDPAVLERLARGSTRAACGAAWPSLSVCMIATMADVSNGFLSTGSICSLCCSPTLLTCSSTAEPRLLMSWTKPK